MLHTYIPSLQFVNPSEKLTAAWASEIAQYYYHHGNMVSLLDGKDIDEIEQYAEGSQTMDEFRKMYKNSQKKKVTKIDKGDGTSDIINILEEDITGIDWEPIDLLNQPLNSAISLIHKQPIEVQAVAIDGLAVTKKKQDRDMIKYKAVNEAILSPISQQLGLSGFIKGPRHSDVPKTPSGMDMEDPEEQDLYFDMFYKFRPESCFETSITQVANQQNAKAYSEFEIRDHFYFGVSVNRATVSDITGLPNLHPYIHPKDVFVEKGCKDKMYRDGDVRYIINDYTISELFNEFGSEIGNEDDLKIVLTNFGRYLNNGTTPTDSRGNIDWGYRVQVYHFEIISIDSQNYSEHTTASGKKRIKFTTEGEKAIHNQNTYSFYWIPGMAGANQKGKNVDGVFKLQRLRGFERKAGQEYKSSFSTRIIKSQKKSAVESCIGHIKMAQKAYIKMQHVIIKSKPPGEYLDLRFMRNAYETLKETDSSYTMSHLLAMYMHNNFYLGDSEGLPPEAMNGKPFMQIPGGIKGEVEGYAGVITNSIAMIAQITGINQQLTGQSSNPAGLVGLQKLLINSSINALHYVTEAITQQYKGLYQHIGWIILEVLKNGGEPAKALKAMIGERKVAILESIEEMTAHQFGIEIQIGMEEELRASLKEKINIMLTQKQITAGNALLVERVANAKDGIAYLLLMERKAKKEEKERLEADRNAMIQAEQVKAQGNAKVIEMQMQGMIAKIQEQAKADAYLQELAHKLSLDTTYVQGMQQKQLQDERNTAQLSKLIAGIQEKVNAEARVA